MPSSPAFSRLGARLALEVLEDRLAPATFTVTDADNAGTGSLRWAINRANASPGADRIEFAIGTGLQTIDLTTLLPAISDRVTIAGQTQPGFAGTPLIELNGASATDGSGLLILPGGSASVVRGLAINRFSGNGIRIRADGCLVMGCAMGTDPAGNIDRGNALDGVNIDEGNNNVIGGAVEGAGNVISGNSGDGVSISGASGNVVRGNVIGTNRAGTVALGNGGTGVVCNTGARANVIGGAAEGAGNLVSGNSIGVIIRDPGTTGNAVLGNLIGTDAAGTAALGNTSIGVFISFGASGNLIGGTTAGARNVISGNGEHGVVFFGGDELVVGNRVQGNYIGTDASGASALGNTGNGVFLNTATRNVIGGATPGAGNVISGNTVQGVMIIGPGARENRVKGNLIGMKAGGNSPLGNTLHGVTISGGANGNVVGGTVRAARNVISGNGAHGVFIESGGTSANRVLGNFIGTDADGSGDFGNALDGVRISGGASGNTVGGTTVAARNVISGNEQYGVRITGVATTDNRVRGNRIGLAVTGAATIGNSLAGVVVDTDASGNVVGGRVAGAGNAISGNGLAGVFITAGTGNSVLANRIFNNGGLGIDLFSGLLGVTPNDVNDADSGANDLLNFPVLTTAKATEFGLRVKGSINTETNKTLRIEFFASPTADPSGHGEGQRFLGFTTVQTGEGNTASFNALLAVFGVEPGQFITVTATDEDGNTSEFSLARLVM